MGIFIYLSGLFEQRVEQYLEELPDTEQSGVNKFLKGLGEYSTAFMFHIHMKGCVSSKAFSIVFIVSKRQQRDEPLSVYFTLSVACLAFFLVDES